MPKTELYGMSGCPYTQEMREWLEWNRREFVEYDVEADAPARARFFKLSGGNPIVPLLAENGTATQVGWQGRGCAIQS